MIKPLFVAAVLLLTPSWHAANAEPRFPTEPASFLADRDNPLLTVALSQSAEKLRALEQEFSPPGEPPAGKRLDYVVALLAVGRTEESRAQLSRARREAASDPVTSDTFGLLDFLLAVRAKAFGEATERLAQVCPEARRDRVCVQFSAQFAGVAGDRDRSVAAMRRLRRAGERVVYPADFIPKEARFDALRVAQYVTYASLDEPLWDTYWQEWRRTATRENLIRQRDILDAGDDSGEAIERVVRLVEFEFNVGNYAGVIDWIKEFETRSLLHHWQTPIELSGWSARAYFSLGREEEARAAMREGEESVWGMVKAPYSRYELLLVFLRSCNVPGLEALVNPYFRKAFEAMARASGAPSRLVAFEAAIALLENLARTGDLQEFEVLRAQVLPLAAELDRTVPDAWVGKRFFAAWLELRTADAVLRHDPRPDRLAAAAAKLAGAIAVTKRAADLSASEGFSGFTRLEEAEGGRLPRSQRVALAAYRFQEAAAPVLGKILMRLGRWDEAVAPLELTHLLTERKMACGKPEEQVAAATDLLRAAEARRNAADIETFTTDIRLCAGLTNNRSAQFAWFMSHEASRYAARGDYYAAEYALARAITIQTGLGRPRDRDLAFYQHQHCELLNEQGDVAYARDAMLSVASIIGSIDRGSWNEEERTAIERQMVFLAGLARGEPDKSRAFALLQDAFVLGQKWLSNEAGAAVEALARRNQIADEKLAALVQQRDELARQRAVQDREFGRLIGTSMSAPMLQRQQGLAGRIRALGEAIGQIDAKIGEAKPLLDLPVVPLAEAQARLAPDEALFYFIAGPGAVLRWTITRSAAALDPLAATAAELSGATARLRCGLDDTAWTWNPDEGASRCGDERRPGRRTVDVFKEPFDVSTAHRLYTGLFGAESSPSQPRWIVVPSGPLAALPFALLATGPAPSGVAAPLLYRRTSWLGIRQALTILPAVATLRSLGAPRTPAERPYIGFGNPVLAAAPAGDELTVLAQRWTTCAARDRHDCASVLPTYRLTSGPRTNVAPAVNFSPIPQTVCEVCAIAETLDARAVEGRRIVRLGTEMTKAAVKRMGAPDPATGRSELQGYRIVHFATHGVMAGQLRGIDEPGLIVSSPSGPGPAASPAPPKRSAAPAKPSAPPQPATAGDVAEELLTAGEIAELRLNADWVILSACNTAASRQRGGEAFSGLARAFLYAGARSILVSHWSVSTNAAVKITTSALAALARNSALTRSEALRDAMQSILDEGEAEIADPESMKLHPAYWGAFAQIGDSR